MKKYLLIAVTALFLVAVPRVAKAQAPAKAAPTAVAHLDLDSLLGIMPAFKSASDSAAMFYKELEKQLYTMTMEYERKMAEYDSLGKTMSPLIKALKEKEINDIQQNIQAFQQMAQEAFTNRRAELLAPVFKSIQKAVKDVAIAKGYTYVVDSSQSASVVLYAADSADIFTAVRIKLGIPEGPKPTPAPGGTPK